MSTTASDDQPKLTPVHYPPRLTRWHHPHATAHLLGWLQGLGEIADGLVTLLTFGCYHSNFEIVLSRHRIQHIIKRHLKARRPT